MMEFERFYEIMSRKLISERSSPELREDVELGIIEVYRKAEGHDMDEKGVELLAETYFSGFLTGRREEQRANSGLVSVSKS